MNDDAYLDPCHGLRRSCAFVVPGIPIGKAKKIGMRGGHAVGYNDAKTAGYMGTVCLCASQVRGESPLLGPVHLELIAVFPRPNKLLERYKDGRLKHGASESRMPKPTKVDLSNVIKGIEDGINGSGVWGDDCQVQQVVASKWYAAVNEAPHVEVVVREVVG